MQMLYGYALIFRRFVVSYCALAGSPIKNILTYLLIMFM